MPQIHPSLPVQNYVYITDCPNVSTVQDVNKQFGNEITTLVASQPIQSNTLTYSLNTMGILEGLTNNGGYTIQHLNVPSVQYQTFSVPMNQSNGLVQPITGKCFDLVMSIGILIFFFSIIKSSTTNCQQQQYSNCNKRTNAKE